MRKYRFLTLSLIFLAASPIVAYTAIIYAWVIFAFKSQTNLSPYTLLLLLTGTVAACSFIFAVMSLIRKEGKLAYLLAPLILITLLVSLFKFII